MNIEDAIIWYETKLIANKMLGLDGLQNDAARLALIALRHMKEDGARAKPNGVHRARCRPPEGVSVKPDGINRLDPCLYEVKEVHTNVTVTVSQCKRCGHIDIGWERQDDTEDITYEELGPEPDDE